MGIKDCDQTFSLNDIQTMFGITRARARYWIESGLVSPEIGNEGRGAKTIFTADQAVKVVLIAALRNEGWTMDEVRGELVDPRWRTSHADLLKAAIEIITNFNTT